jgi:hypothetical protein
MSVSERNIKAVIGFVIGAVIGYVAWSFICGEFRIIHWGQSEALSGKEQDAVGFIARLFGLGAIVGVGVIGEWLAWRYWK